MDSRFRGNDDIILVADIHDISKLKWYKGEGTFAYPCDPIKGEGMVVPLIDLFPENEETLACIHPTLTGV